MQLKERWTRWRLRKSVSSGASSSSSSGNSDATPPRVASAVYVAFPDHLKYNTTTISSNWRPSPSTKISSWRNTAITMVPEKRAPSPSSRRNKKKKKGKAALKRLHPSERTLTEQNLRHQEMLGTFTMKFGKRRRGSVGEGAWEGISPGNSRACSVVEPRGGADFANEDEGPFGERRESSLLDVSAARARLEGVE